MSNNGQQNAGEWKSISDISDISDRVVTNWSEEDDMNLQEASPSYQELLQEITKLQPLLDKHAVDEPFSALQRDTEYLSARTAMQETLQHLDERLRL
jgi:polyhydroxyalkanoate synthesis regulator phasin